MVAMAPHSTIDDWKDFIFTNETDHDGTRGRRNPHLGSFFGEMICRGHARSDIATSDVVCM
jgi:hypothetical protein